MHAPHTHIRDLAELATRRTATIVAVHVAGAEALWRDLPQPMRVATCMLDTTLRRLLAQWGGTELAAEGDAVLAAFGSSRRAIAFCTALQVELFEQAWPERLREHDASASEPGFRGLRARVGVHRGRASAFDDPELERTVLAGPAVQVAVSLCQAAAPGQILASRDVLARMDDCVAGASTRLVGLHCRADSEGITPVFAVLPYRLSARAFPTPVLASAAQTRRTVVPALEPLDGTDRRLVPLTRTVTHVGRSAACDVRLHHPTISGRHMALGTMPDGRVWVLDCGSTNGIAVDGVERRGCGVVGDGAVLRLGARRLRVRERALTRDLWFVPVPRRAPHPVVGLDDPSTWPPVERLRAPVARPGWLQAVAAAAATLAGTPLGLLR